MKASREYTGQERCHETRFGAAVDVIQCHASGRKYIPCTVQERGTAENLRNTSARVSRTHARTHDSFEGPQSLHELCGL